jgi:intracellular septation protein
MKTALLQLAEDFLSTFVFLGIYLAAGNLPVAIGFALAVGAGQLVFVWWKRRSIETMQWLSLGLVVVLGGAALLTADARFMMAKPSIIHFAVGVVMLRPGWMVRYMPPLVTAHVPANVLTASGYAWAGLMFVLGLTNLYVAAMYSPVVWAWFISAGAVGAKILAFALQYLVLWIFIRRDLRQVQPPPEPA